jgi:hypothetical protein
LRLDKTFKLPAPETRSAGSSHARESRTNDRFWDRRLQLQMTLTGAKQNNGSSPPGDPSALELGDPVILGRYGEAAEQLRTLEEAASLVCAQNEKSRQLPGGASLGRQVAAKSINLRQLRGALVSPSLIEPLELLFASSLAPQSHHRLKKRS